MARKYGKILLLASIVCFLMMFAFTNVLVLNGKITTAQPTKVNAVTSTDYYAGLNTSLTGESFRSELAKLITNTQTYNTTYDELRNVFKYSDADPDVSGNIIWFYTGTSFKFNGSFTSGTNREHVWPKNAGKAFPEKTYAGSDAHHLRPANSSLNSSRGNNNFGEVATTNANIVKENSKTAYKYLCYQANSVFYPGETFRGATARILMYVQTRWGDTYNLKFVLGKGESKTIGDIEDLLKWHYMEPPTELEKIRNDYIETIQGNRNPFIDHPEFATKIYCYDGESYNTTLQNVAKQYDKYTNATEVAQTLTLTPSSATLEVGETTTIVPTVTPVNSTTNYTYQSSNQSVATVNSNGVVTAVGEGSTTITVTETVSGLTKTATITVPTTQTPGDAQDFKTYVIMAKAKLGESTCYEYIVKALNAYNQLDEETKVTVYNEYQTLLEVINSYNEQTVLANGVKDQVANDVALVVPLSAQEKKQTVGE